MQRHADPLRQACSQLKAVAQDLQQNPPQRIGYQERVRIERPLFLVMKEICRQELSYDLQGLGEKHYRRLKAFIGGKGCGKSMLDLIRRAFELRVFLLDLSNANPYVQGDALSRASLTKYDAVRTLSRTLITLARRAMEQEGKQSPLPDDD